jgi:peptidoglycan/xylan/chitin deacetylase (PgdA/CDA1 family)
LSELERQIDTVEDILGKYAPPDGHEKHVKWFRPGHGWLTPAMLALCRSKGYKLALGSVFGNDPWVRSVPLLRWFYAARAYPGAVLIIHDGLQSAREQTVAILDGALGELKRRGYRVTTLTELYLVAAHKMHTT